MTGPAPTIALVGNPNAGKSSLFNALTGARQKIANYPGVTVERKSGHASFADGRPLAALTRRRGTLTLTLKTAGLEGFDDWLAQNLVALHETWRKTAKDGEPGS